jgi:hypothetical protein
MVCSPRVTMVVAFMEREPEAAMKDDGVGIRTSIHGQGVARPLPPEGAAAEDVAGEIGIGADTLKRCRSEALAKTAREQARTAVARSMPS